jgi:hypothetical protein
VDVLGDEWEHSKMVGRNLASATVRRMLLAGRVALVVAGVLASPVSPRADDPADPGAITVRWMDGIRMESAD